MSENQEESILLQADEIARMNAAKDKMRDATYYTPSVMAADYPPRSQVDGAFILAELMKKAVQND